MKTIFNDTFVPKMGHCLFTGFILVMFLSCHGHKHDPSEHEERSHDTPLLLTGYNEHYEVFAEATPLAIGEKSNLAVHLTTLSKFKPVQSGVVTASLIVGTKTVVQTLDTPSVIGIYRFQLTPETAGNGRLVFDIQSATGTSQIQIQDIRVFEAVHDAEHAAEDESVKHINAITFTKEQSWKIDFATELPTMEPFGQIIRTTAQVQSSQVDETIVVARTAGIVFFTSSVAVEGRNIAVGQELFSVSGQGMADNNVHVRLAEAQNNYLKAETNYNRAKELVKDKIVSDKEFLQIKSEYEMSKVVYDNLYKNFTEKGQQVSSPITGYVKQLFVNNGQYVDAGQPLLSVSKNKTLLLKADVQMKYAPDLPFIASANIRSMDQKTTYSLEELNGKILSFGKSVNENNYLIPVLFQVDNKAGLIPGGFVEIYIKTQMERPSMTINSKALTEEQGVFFVYVQLTPELFEKREVKIGMSDGLRTEIISGLDKGERVVTIGAISVKLAQSSGALDPHAGHVH